MRKVKIYEIKDKIMIIINTDELENLCLLVHSYASKSEELKMHINRLYNEMLNDDFLSVYLRNDELLAGVATAYKKLERCYDILMKLNAILNQKCEEYKTTEQSFQKKIEALKERADLLRIQTETVMTGTIDIKESSDETVSLIDSIVKLVSDSETDMELINIAAVSKTVRDEYVIDDVKSVSYDRINQASEEMKFTNAALEMIKPDDEDDEADL